MSPRRVDRWEAHPVLAWWVRVAVLLVPLLVSLLVALALIAAVPRPDHGWAELGWWLLVLGVAFAAAQLIDRLARQALPLAVLLRLSLVFPDRAPSRLRTARRTSLREIERSLQGAEEPGEAARTLVALVGALGLHDRRTRGHSERVRAYVDMLTEQMRLPEEDRSRLRWAALLHDIGKLSVPQPVLNGGPDLAEDEWAQLRRHPVEGERLTRGLMPWLGEWGRCVREHHEHWDGSGYPAGLRGTEISLGARIVAVADAYEVMTANRSYRSAVGPAAAREELARCAGKDFDPAVVRAFLQIGLGRLRGVLGPLSLLPALPVAAATDRAGDVVRGLTNVAAVSAVALAVSGGAVATPMPAPTVRPPQAVAPQVAAVLPTPSPAPAAQVVAAPASQPARVAAVAPSRRAAPKPVAAPQVLYLSPAGALVTAAPAAGAAALVPGHPTAFTVAGPLALRTAQLVLVHHLVARHGAGHPRATVTVLLQDCAATCTTLGRQSSRLVPVHGYAAQRVTLPVRSTVPAGHVLRLVLVLTAHDNVDRVLVACGGSKPSRLGLG